MTCSELYAINKAHYARWCCRCGDCSKHLSYVDEILLKTIGPYAFASIKKLTDKGVEVEFVYVRPIPENEHMFVAGTKGRVLAVDRFHQLGERP